MCALICKENPFNKKYVFIQALCFAARNLKLNTKQSYHTIISSEGVIVDTKARSFILLPKPLLVTKQWPKVMDECLPTIWGWLIKMGFVFRVKKAEEEFTLPCKCICAPSAFSCFVCFWVNIVWLYLHHKTLKKYYLVSLIILQLVFDLSF